jgi:membrane protein YdbS with pleckstrin-like domain
MLLTLRMNFTNNLIHTDELPAIEEVIFSPLERDFLTVERISLAIGMGILLVIVAILFSFIDRLQSPMIIASAVTVYGLFVSLNLIALHINYKYSGYALREKDMLYRSGWLQRKTRIVMISRIQHVSVQSGPLERRFGLASVSVFTAGSAAADFTIKGIKEETAKKIKAWISIEPKGDGEY